MTKTYKVVPIDVDFAGWTEVEAGEHNAWGIVDSEGFLIGYCSIKSPADRIAKRLFEDQPNNPRAVFLNYVADPDTVKGRVWE